TTISQAGPSQDGINHDEDEIWLLLKPTVNMAVSSSTTEWSLAATNAPVQYVHVGWLNGHETMPPGVVAALQDAGITPHEYPKILARDPLAADESALNSVRFASINTTFPYEPPYSLNDSVPTFTYNISNSTVTTTGTAAEDSFGVELSVSGSASFTGLFDVKVKDTSTWEWTNKFSTSASAGSSQSAQLTIGGPAYGYAGASVIRVYYDTIYRTFAFALVSPAAPEVALKGTLLTPTGKPAANKRVTLIGSGQKHLTYTNAKGEFTFIGHMSGKVTVQAPGVTQQIPQVQSTRQIVLHP
ncbi:MAG: carboxypeptidase-like regulatory domain-containing protein, partial [Candidatus Sulfotelmatobacter sp.]